jgi:IS605 OrfB family transposase
LSTSSATYQGRLTLSSDQEQFFSTYAFHYNHVERTLYADMQRSGNKAASFKNDYLVRFGITARQFNAIGRNLEGKISSVLELLPLQKQDLEAKIVKAKAVIKKIKVTEKLHQKRRRLHNLETRLVQLEQQIKGRLPKICFGSRRLFRKQFSLEDNGYRDHQEWLQEWVGKRNSQFYVLGSKDETAGCQGCTISANMDGTFNLRLRSLSKEAQYVLIENVAIKYGHDVLREAMRHPQALSYRFLRDAKGWRVFVTTDLPEIKRLSLEARDIGAVGIDINADCLALAETNRHGNLVTSRIIPLVTYGKTPDQAEALIGEAVKAVVEIAVTTGKPLVIERLDFSKKKASLETEDPKHARMITSLAYGKVIQGIKARAYRFGIEVLEVNPAYTSTIGAVNYAHRFGISTHQAAAFAISRRGLGFSEKPVKRPVVPVRNGGHVTLPVPVRKRGKHVWTQWAVIRKKLLAAHVAHARSGFSKTDPAPLRFNPLESSTWALPARSRHANRQQHCLADVMGEDIPW